jgi:hypothetical protein
MEVLIFLLGDPILLSMGTDTMAALVVGRDVDARVGMQVKLTPGKTSALARTSLFRLPADQAPDSKTKSTPNSNCRSHALSLAQALATLCLGSQRAWSVASSACRSVGLLNL